MQKKQIYILVFALVVLVGGIYIVARSISERSQSNSWGKNNPAINPKGTIDMFGQDNGSGTQKETAEVMGNVSRIAEKTLTVKHLQEAIDLNINGATPVMLSMGANSPITGQMADLNTNDAVKVTYETNTKNVIMILVVRP